MRFRELSAMVRPRHDRSSSRGRGFLLLLLVVGLLLPTTAANAWDRPGVREVTPESFGLHAFQGRPGVTSSWIRMSCSGDWAVAQKLPGRFDWQTMDMWVDRYEQWGYAGRILQATCHVPSFWAQKKQGEPKKLSDWRSYVTEMVKRYRGRIAAYETFNEATSTAWYQGSPAKMAKMTRILYQAVQKYDPAATVVSASMQIHVKNWWNRFSVPYLRKLKQLGWPIDVVALHTYTLNNPFNRMEQVSWAKEKLSRLRPPRRIQLWDTEINYPQDKARKHQDALIAQTYIESWRLGLQKTFWFVWTERHEDWLGVQLYPGRRTIPTYARLQDWTVGARVRKCQERNNVVQCRFTGKGRFTLAFSDSALARVRLGKRSRVCRVDNGKCSSARKFKLTRIPVRIDGHPNLRSRR